MPEERTRLLEQIKDLTPINKLPPDLQARLLDQAQIQELKKSRFLFKQGNQDNYSYFLLEGEIELLVGKRGGDFIKGGSDRARHALAHIQPRQFSAQARTKARVLIIERNSLDQLLVLADQSDLGAPSAKVNGTGVDSIQAAPQTDWMTQLLHAPLFSRIPMANLQQLFSRLEPVEYEAGTVVIRQGDPGDYYYIISRGRCAVSRKSSARSNDVKIAELGAGDSFGEGALVSNSKHNVTITMLSAGVLMRLGKNDFVKLIKTPTLRALTYKEALALIEQGGQWLDVRLPDEYREGAIAGSVNIPLHSLRQESAKLDEAKRYVLYCDTTKRSSAGAFLLAKRGFEVAYLAGGLRNNPKAIEAGRLTPKPPASKAKSAPPPAPKVAKSAPSPAPKAVKSASPPAPKAAKPTPSSAPKAVKSAPSPAPKAAKSALPPVPKAAKSAPSPAPKVTKSPPSPAPKAVKSAPPPAPKAVKSAPSPAPGEQAGKDIDKEKALEALRKQVEEACKKLERQKKEVEAEAKKKVGKDTDQKKALEALRKQVEEACKKLERKKKRD